MALIVNCLLVFLIVLVANSKTAKILAFFPFPSISHQVVFRPLTQELARRGHEITVITTDPAFPKGQAPVNFTEIDIHDVSYKIWRDKFVLSVEAQEQGTDWPSQASIALGITVSLFEQQLLLDEVRSIIFDKTKKFDLLILEAVVIPLLGITSVIKAPVIQISSLGPYPYNVDAVGAPMHVFLSPTPSQQRVGNKLTMWEKIDQLTVFYKMNRVFAHTFRLSDEMLKRTIGTDTPPLTELNNNVDMLFLNVHPLWDVNRPMPPNVIYMGRLHEKPEKELPKELKSYLDSSKNGVMYISFGTNVEPSLLPAERIQAIINVVSKLNYDILWKWNKDELAGRTANIRISKWLPQSDMLRHPKIKLFITQAGLQSTDEAITAGVPLLGIPMLGDQWYNADLYEYYKIGKRLDLERITEENFRDAINTIIADGSYRKNIAKMRALMSDEPQKPLERAIWWTEYVLRHGGAKHLLSPAANISWTEFLELELVLYLSLALISVLVSFIILICYLRRLFGSASKVKKSKLH